MMVLVVGIIVALLGGVVIGWQLCARSVPGALARMTPQQLQALAKNVAERRGTR